MDGATPWRGVVLDSRASRLHACRRSYRAVQHANDRVRMHDEYWTISRPRDPSAHPLPTQHVGPTETDVPLTSEHLATTTRTGVGDDSPPGGAARSVGLGRATRHLLARVSSHQRVRMSMTLGLRDSPPGPLARSVGLGRAMGPWRASVPVSRAGGGGEITISCSDVCLWRAVERSRPAIG